MKTPLSILKRNVVTSLATLILFAFTLTLTTATAFAKNADGLNISFTDSAGTPKTELPFGTTKAKVKLSLSSSIPLLTDTVMTLYVSSDKVFFNGNSSIELDFSKAILTKTDSVLTQEFDIKPSGGVGEIVFHVARGKSPVLFLYNAKLSITKLTSQPTIFTPKGDSIIKTYSPDTIHIIRFESNLYAQTIRIVSSNPTVANINQNISVNDSGIFFLSVPQGGIGTTNLIITMSNSKNFDGDKGLYKSYKYELINPAKITSINANNVIPTDSKITYSKNVDNCIVVTTGLPAGTTFTVTSSNPAVATTTMSPIKSDSSIISITSRTAGSTVITFRPTNTYYATTIGTLNLTVDSIKNNNFVLYDKLTLLPGKPDTIALNTTNILAGDIIRLTSSNPLAISVPSTIASTNNATQSIQITTGISGSAEITATIVNGNAYSNPVVKHIFTVKQLGNAFAVPVTIDSSYGDKPDSSYTISCKLPNTQKVFLRSDNTLVATVDSMAIVIKDSIVLNYKIGNAGTAKIYASFDNANYAENGRYIHIATINVAPILAEGLSPTDSTIKYNQTDTLISKETNLKVGTVLAISRSDANIVIVPRTTVVGSDKKIYISVTGLNVGSTQIYISFTDPNFSNSGKVTTFCNLTVAAIDQTPIVNTSTEKAHAVGDVISLPSKTVEGAPITYTTTTTTDTIKIYGHTVVCEKASTAGIIIQGSAPAITNYNALAAANVYKIKSITAKTDKIPDIGEMTLGVGQNIFLPQFSVGGVEIVYTATNNNAGTVSIGANLLIALKADTATITATTLGSSTYDAITHGTPFTVNVNEAMPTIDFNFIGDVKTGDTIILNAIPSNNGTITYAVKKTDGTTNTDYTLTPTTTAPATLVFNTKGFYVVTATVQYNLAGTLNDYTVSQHVRVIDPLKDPTIAVAAITQPMFGDPTGTITLTSELMTTATNKQAIVISNHPSFISFDGASSTTVDFDDITGTGTGTVNYDINPEAGISSATFTIIYRGDEVFKSQLLTTATITTTKNTTAATDLKLTCTTTPTFTYDPKIVSNELVFTSNIISQMIKVVSDNATVAPINTMVKTDHLGNFKINVPMSNVDTASLKVTFTANDMYTNGKEITVNYVINPITNTLTITDATPTPYAKDGTVVVTLMTTNILEGEKIFLSSSNPNVLSVPAFVTHANGTTQTFNALMVGTGSATLTATIENANHYTIKTATSNPIVIRPIVTTIAIAQTTQSDIVHGSTTTPMTLTLTGFAAGDVIYLTSSNPDVLSVPTHVVLGNIPTTAVFNAQVGNVGTATLTASSTRSHISISQDSKKFTVIQGEQVVTLQPIVTPLTYVAGQTFTINATSTGDGVISYFSTNKIVATVTGNIVQILKPGTTYLYATAAETTGYKASPNTPPTETHVTYAKTLVVEKGVQTIDFFLNPSVVTFGTDTIPLRAISTSGLVVTFTSGNEAVATIADTILTMKKTGVVTITTSQTGNEYYKAATDVVAELTIEAAHQWIKVANTHYTKNYVTDYKATQALGATIVDKDNKPTGGTLKYESSDPSVASVNEHGHFTVLNAGVTTITISEQGNESYLPAEPVKVEVQVTKGARTVEIKNTDTYLAVGNNLQMNAELVAVKFGGTPSSTIPVAPDDKASFVWSVTDASQATISSTGILSATGVTIPTPKITVNVYAEATRNYERTNPKTYELNSTQLTQHISFTNLKPGTYEYNHEPIVLETHSEVTENTAVGQAFIYAVTDSTPNDAGKEVVTIKNGILSFTGVGTATVTATNQGNTQYGETSFDVEITVVPAQDEIIWDLNNPTQVQITDSALLLDARAKSGRQITYTIEYDNPDSKPEIVKVTDKNKDGKAFLTFHNIGNARVIATPDTSSNYKAIHHQKTIIVTKSDRWISFDDPMTGMKHTFGDIPVQLKGVSFSRDSVLNHAHVNNGTKVLFRSSNPKIIGISEKGEMIFNGAGTATIIAYQPDLDSYYSVPEEIARVVTIAKAPVIVAWTSAKTPMNVLESLPLDGKVTYVQKTAGGTPGVPTPALGAPISYTITGNNGYFLNQTNNKVYPVTREGHFYAYSATAANPPVQVTLSTPETENFLAATYTIEITIEEADQLVVFDQYIDNGSGTYIFGQAPLSFAAKAYENYTNITPKFDQSYPIRSITYTLESQKSLENADQTNIASIDATTGLVTIRRSGKFTVKATQVTDVNFNTNSASFNVTVNRAPQVITPVSIAAQQKTLNGLYTGEKVAVNLDIEEINNEEQGTPTLTYIKKIDNKNIVTEVGVASFTVTLAETVHYEKSEPLTFSFQTWGTKQVTPTGKIVYVQPYGVGKGDGSSADNATGLLDVALNAVNNSREIDSLMVTEGVFTESRINEDEGSYVVNADFNVYDGLNFRGGQAVKESWKTVDTQRTGYTTLDAHANSITPRNKSVVSTRGSSTFIKRTILDQVHFANGYFVRLGGENRSNVAAIKIIGNMFVSNSYFENNYIDGNGSVVELNNGHIINSYFDYNTAGLGATIGITSNQGGTILNCVFSGNENVIKNISSSSKIINNTFVDNIGDLITSSKPISIYNNLFWSNTSELGENVTLKNSATDMLPSNCIDTDYNTHLTSVALNTTDTSFDETSPNFVGNYYDELTKLALNKNALLINRGDTIIEDVIKKFPKSIHPELDIAGNARIQKGYPDIGAFENAGKGWIKINLEQEDVEYSSEKRSFTKYVIEPRWNANQKNDVNISYKNIEKTSNNWVETITEAASYEVKISAYTANSDNDNNWNQATHELASGFNFGVKPLQKDAVWLASTPTDVEWKDGKSYKVNIDSSLAYLTTDSAHYTITYSSINIFGSAKFNECVETYTGGLLTGASGALPQEVGQYNVIFKNTNTNYNIEDKAVTLSIRSQTIVEDKMVIEGLSQPYDAKIKDISITFNDVAPQPQRSDTDQNDYQVRFYDQKDSPRDFLVRPISIGSYDVEILMGGTSDRFAGHFNGRFLKKMDITNANEDPYALHIPVKLVTDNMPKTITIKDKEIQTFKVKVEALERTPDKGQKILLNTSWSFSDHVFSTSESKEIVFDGVSKFVEFDLTVVPPEKIPGNRYMKIKLSQFGSNKGIKNQVSLRSVAPDIHIVTVLVETPETITPKKTDCIGFNMKQTVIKGSQPINVTFNIPTTTTYMEPIEFKITYPKNVGEPKITVRPGYTLTKTAKGATVTSARYLYAKTNGAIEAGTHQFLFETPEFNEHFNKYKNYTLTITKARYKNNTKFVNVRKNISKHTLSVENNNPKVHTLLARFVYEKDRSPSPDSMRFIALFGSEEELTTVDSRRIDVTNVVQYDTGTNDVDLMRRTLSVRLEQNGDVITAAGGTINAMSGRLLGYRFPKIFNENGYSDSVVCYIDQASGGQTKATLHIYVGPRINTGSEINITPALFEKNNAFTKAPNIYGLYFKNYVPYKLGKPQKVTKIALRSSTKVSAKNSKDSMLYKMNTKLLLYNKKTINPKGSFLLDALAVDSTHLMQFNRLGVKIQGTIKNENLEIKPIHQFGCIVTPPVVNYVKFAQYPGNSSNQMIKNFVIVQGENFGQKPTVLLQYFDARRQRHVKQKGVTIYSKPSSKIQHVASVNGSEFQIPQLSKPVRNGYIIVKFPNSWSVDKLFEKAKKGDDGVTPRVDLIIESGSGIGGNRDIMEEAAYNETQTN